MNVLVQKQSLSLVTSTVVRSSTHIQTSAENSRSDICWKRGHCERWNDFWLTSTRRAANSRITCWIPIKLAGWRAYRCVVVELHVHAQRREGGREKERELFVTAMSRFLMTSLQWNHTPMKSSLFLVCATLKAFLKVVTCPEEVGECFVDGCRRWCTE